MTAFQFDKCFDDVAVIDDCNAEQVAQAIRLDERLWKAKDPELLRVLMNEPVPMITIDRKLPRKHAVDIPEKHPGIIVVAYSQYLDRSKETLKTITTRAAAKILRLFKKNVPNWHQVAVKNSIVEITDKGVEISHVEKGQIKFDKYIEYGNFQDELEIFFSTLHINSLRHAAIPLE